MNMAANPDKMAVTDNQSTIPVQGSESKEENDVRHQGKTINDKKKSTFKITSVTKNLETADLSNDADHDVEHDSMDDLDETVESHTEDASSEILDISKHTDGGELASPMEEETSDNVTKENVVSHVSSTKETTQKSEQTNSNVKETHVKNKDKTDQQGPHSTRFKVVKIETREPFKRGRWTCLDTLDYPAPDKSDTKINIADSSALSSVNSTHHIGSMVDNPLKNPAKAANVIQGESKENFHGDNYQNSLTTHQSQPSSQSQIQQTSVSSNVQSNVAQQQIQTHQLPSNFHSSTIHSQPISNVNTSFAQGQSSMQTSDKPQTSYVYDSSAIWQMPNAIQTISNTDKSVKFNQEQFVSHHNSVIPNVDNKELDSVMSRTIGANIQQNSTNIEVQGAILTPQSVAEVVGMIPSPQEEDRNTRNFSAISPLTPGARGSSTVAIDNKIEQAMDLVKSHLMYAVREEVEVLKEQIKELMDKNSQLEYENQILKNSASPETLAKLSNLPPSSSS